MKQCESQDIAANANDRNSVGTLRYTRLGLAMLFFWLLWGDFVFIIMECVVPSIIPLKLHALRASDWIIGVIIVTIPRGLDMLINPIVSYMSDRTRTRWGRRRPFLLVATPVISLTLIMMAYAGEITSHVARWSGRPTVSAGLAIAVIAVLMVLFQIGHMFVSSVYYYFFNDVVPKGYLSRFMAAFRVVGTLAGAAYGYFIYGMAETHSRQIFLGTAVLYLVVFGSMCLFVTEGAYPPVPATIDGRRGSLSAIKTFAVECFSQRIYWYFFLANACWAVGLWCIGSYGQFYAASVGVSLDALGKANAFFSVISAMLLFPMGAWSDRRHPLNVNYIGVIVMLVFVPMQAVFVIPGFPPAWGPAVYYVLMGVYTVTWCIYNASEFPMFMRILPQDRFGQFCSANAIVRGLAVMAGAPAVGFLLGYIKRYETSPNEHYRWGFVWTSFFLIFAFVFMRLLHREWRRLGGAAHYVAPIRRAVAAAEAGSDSEVVSGPASFHV